ncbi:MAG: ATP-grasp domain-containing protein [Motiliproteus sp.]|nr:ATP-grasp domain-containing protein [Motiliproteus sp.]MCW9051075.1 ATP-grasp domain-containing protein [Motiliproteus sp.]
MPHLILVHQPSKQALSDYHAIADLIGQQAPDIKTHIVDTKDTEWCGIEAPDQEPVLTVSPLPIKKFQPPGGRICQGFEYRKGEQNQRMRDIGVSVPDWTELTPETELDLDFWGPFVVVKPELGRKGAEIVIKRTGRVRYKEPEQYDAEHPIQKAPMIVQRFIYTGPWPINYRVVTLFGKTLLCWRCEADHGKPPLESKYAFTGVSIVSNKKTSKYSLAFDEDVIALAEKAHQAFPDQPVLGTDIIRDAETGELYVLETNPRGDAWLISSDMGRMIESANGLNFTEQFGALDIAAKVLIEKTRELAQSPEAG